MPITDATRSQRAADAAEHGARAPGAGAAVYVGLGANLGDARAMLAWAARRLLQQPGIDWRATSGLYRSAPVDAAGPDYLNAVLALGSTLAPAALLATLQSIEFEGGRVRSYRNAPRLLDLDLLLVDDRVLETPALTLPHPRLHRRRFVLQPLAEIAPGLVVPGHGPLQALLAAVQDQALERIAGSEWF